MNCNPARSGKWALVLAAAAGFFTIVAPLFAQDVPHLNFTQPGGFPGWPVITGIEKGSNNVTLTWDGPSGYCKVYKALSLSGAQWKPVATNYTRKATITGLTSNAFFRVLGPSPQYAGSAACNECHADIHTTEMNTRHAHALETLKGIGQGNNASCLPCHTVGYGLPTGFKTEATTPYLAGVQCENCHGPAALHAANPDDITVRPQADIAGQICGGCHTDSHHPTYDEWSGSGHFAVVEDMNLPSRINSCGRCHSGTSRLALLNGEDPALTVTGDANVGITCVVCHDPHQTNANPAQLRNPVYSTNDFYLTTTDVFSNKYNPNINVCAQCHNHRGAAWNSTSTRAPHHSPQYNVLIGTVGVRANGSTNPMPSSHALKIGNQCAGCHMQTQEAAGLAPANTGHSFQVQSYESCMECHLFPEQNAMFVMAAMAARIQEVKTSLDVWALTKSPEVLRTNYGALAWEYSPPGDLSANTPGRTNVTQQALIPDNIKKARFNLYIVNYDGSFGIHNGPYSFELLNAATNWIQTELNK